MHLSFQILIMPYIVDIVEDEDIFSRRAGRGSDIGSRYRGARGLEDCYPWRGGESRQKQHGRDALKNTKIGNSST